MAVLVDLDDTIYPQSAFLKGAYDAVADCAACFGLPRNVLRQRLTTIAAEGTDRGRIIDRAVSSLKAEGVATDHVPIAALVDAFHGFAPQRLTSYPGAVAALRCLRKRMRLALVTDGDVRLQRAKLRALGLEEAFDAVVFSDTYGRASRKPSSVPFRRALDLLAVEPHEAVMVGDRPDKDIAGAILVGLKAVRVRTGEYARQPDWPKPWASADSLSAAADFLLSAPKG
jgi:putative hydrolase of the HAD superfamily